MATASLVFLIPKGPASVTSGGYLTQQRLLAALRAVETIEVVEYEHRAIESLATLPPFDSSTLFFAGWGPDAERLQRALTPRPFVYWANSVGWKIRLPSRTAIVCGSRFTLGYWGEIAPDAPLYYLPNPIENEFTNRGLDRDIDVLVQARKTSSYLSESLLPRLRQLGLRVEVLAESVPDMAELFNRTRVYLYDSRDFWLERGVSEGFGLPPLEAMACGCAVFSSVNGGVSDYLDPPFRGFKIGNYAVEYDVTRVARAASQEPIDVDDFIRPYRPQAVAERWRSIATELREFFMMTREAPGSVSHRILEGPRIYTTGQLSRPTLRARSIRALSRIRRRSVRVRTPGR